MTTENSPLFSPLKIGSLTLPGRLFKTARGEAPLIITGNIYVSRDGKSAPAHLGAQPAECYHPTVKAEKDAMLAREAVL